MGEASRVRTTGLDGDTVGDPMEPGSQRFAATDGAGLADQDEKGGLEGVFGAVGVTKDRAAGVIDHRAMPLDKRSEGRLVPIIKKTAEELAVRDASERAVVEELLKCRAEG
jgi:hypothetical protein